MGRELKRVPLGFVWPLNEVWIGYCQEPFPPCLECDGTGYGREARAISDAFYAFDAPESIRWCDKLSQLEVDHLWKKGRLKYWYGSAWQTETAPPASDVNRDSQQHDTINMHILVRFRCKRLGISVWCPACKGHGW